MGGSWLAAGRWADRLLICGIPGNKFEISESSEQALAQQFLEEPGLISGE